MHGTRTQGVWVGVERGKTQNDEHEARRRGQEQRMRRDEKRRMQMMRMRKPGKT